MRTRSHLRPRLQTSNQCCADVCQSCFHCFSVFLGHLFLNQWYTEWLGEGVGSSISSRHQVRRLVFDSYQTCTFPLMNCSVFLLFTEASYFDTIKRRSSVKKQSKGEYTTITDKTKSPDLTGIIRKNPGDVVSTCITKMYFKGGWAFGNNLKN